MMLHASAIVILAVAIGTFAAPALAAKKPDPALAKILADAQRVGVTKIGFVGVDAYDQNITVPQPATRHSLPLRPKHSKPGQHS